MTNKETIEILKHEQTFCHYGDSTYIALDTAIKSLEAYDKILPLLNPDIDAELALEKIREVMYE